MRVRQAGLVFLGVAMLSMMGARTLSAQLIPLLPPIEGESNEEATPQQTKAVQAVQADLIAERFDQLDELADRLRQTKARVTGGGWRLRLFYNSLMLAGNPSDAAIKEHMTHLEHWMTQRPESITPWIAAAETLHQWAWEARGSGVADTVTADGWKLYTARIEREEQVLQTAGKLAKMCPQWYSETMSVGLAAGWERARMQDVFDRGIQFEPGYFYLYRDYANYLLPKWEGHRGDTTAFAKAEADRAGGDEGDLIYFYIATVVIRRGNGGIPKGEMDWERIKRGEHVLERKYGVTRAITNELAFMAYTYRDATVAKSLFASIGDRWTVAVWKSHTNYDHARQWAMMGGAAPADPGGDK
jgi:Domain of unknown function (DUF4034)